MENTIEKRTPSTLLRHLNERRIMNVVRQHGQISRAEMERQLGLTTPTILRITNRLVNKGWLREAGVAESSYGRPPVMIEINRSGFGALGIEIGRSTTRLVYTNLLAEMVAHREISTYQLTTPEDFIDFIKTFMQDYSLTNEVIIGIGITSPNMWNTKENRFMLEGNRQLLTLDNGMDWYEIPIVDLVSEALNIPTSFMQDAKAAALGEAWFGHGREASHVAFILVDAGVGAGFVINGETFDGAENKAGEFSHTVVDLHGELGTCGHRGCVSEGASEPSIFRAVRKGRLVLQRETVEDIIHRAFAGQSPDMEVIQRTLDYLSAGIANLARILDPDVVILGGRTMLCDEHMVEETRARVQEFCRPEKQIAVLPANFGLWAVSVGAAVSVLQNIYVVRSYEQYLGK